MFGFKWENGNVTSLLSSTPYFYTLSSINESNVVTGTIPVSPPGTYHAVTWQNGSLSELTSGQASSYGFTVNNSGTVAGMYIDLNGLTQAAIWQGGTMSLLPTPASSNKISRANGINDRGDVVGIFADLNQTTTLRAVLWQNGTMIDLGTPAGKHAYAQSINNSGQILGKYANGDGTYNVFLWQNGILSDLGNFGQVMNLANQTPNRINDAGQAFIPTFIPQGNNKTFVAYRNSIVNLKDLPEVANMGVSVPTFWAGNSSGQAIGNGSLNGEYFVLKIRYLDRKTANTTPYDATLSGKATPPSSPTSPACIGMCGYDAHTSSVSLLLNDTPVGYTPAVGPPAYIRLSYNQRGAAIPSSLYNVGYGWTLNLLSYVQDDPVSPGQRVLRYVAGGGMVDYNYDAGIYNSGNGNFAAETKTQAILKRIPATGAATSYELTFPDGAKQVFSKSDGSSTWPRRFLLTQIYDPKGKALTLSYDTQLRLASMSDALNKVTTFCYTVSGNCSTGTDKKIYRIIDPYNRIATLVYDATGRLASITDVIGIKSSFTYDASSQIVALDTPYGTSVFAFGENLTQKSRYLELTDPLGKTERLEYRPNAPSVASTEANLPSGINTNNGFYNLYNTFYWDRHVKTTYGNTDYNKAIISHWQHDDSGQLLSDIETLKLPGQNRIYFNYPGQSNASSAGTISSPSAIARRLDNGVTQTRSFEYNVYGKITKVIDPLLRESTIAYEPNGIDPAIFKQKISPTVYETTGKYENYNSQHLPEKYTDAGGQIWLPSYNVDGQLTNLTNPLGQYTLYNYDASKRLANIKNNSNIQTLTLTYDAFDRVRTSTDSEGYVLTYDYDALDRVTKVTYPDGTTVQYDYNFPGTWPIVAARGTPSLDLWKVTDRMGRVTNYAYNQARQLISKTETATVSGSETTRTTNYEYYANGTIKNLIDANGNITHWDIDVLSRPITKTYAYGTANAKSESYTYDFTGRLKTKTDSLGQVKTISYKDDNSIAGFTYTTVTGQPVTKPVSFTYDDYWPRLTRVNDFSGPLDVNGQGTAAYTDFEYTPLLTPGALQLSGESHSTYYNQHMGYFYDALGRLSQQWSAESPETFTYDNLGRLVTYNAEVGASNPIMSVSYAYLGQTSQLLSRTTVFGTTTQITNWGYDTNINDRRLLSINHNDPAVRSYAYAYSYTPTGGGSATDVYNIRKITESTNNLHPLGAQVWTYNYDKSDRLLSAAAAGAPKTGGGNWPSVGNFGWQLDKLDNPTQVSYPTYTDFPQYLNSATPPVSNNLNQMSRNAWWQNYSYDANGNTTREYNDQGTNLHVYKYDFEGRLVEIQQQGGLKLTYLYDGLGRRISNVVNNNGSVTSLTRVWCGMRPCQLRSGTLSLRRYTLEGEYDNVSNARQLYLRDHQGSVRDMIQLSSGTRIGAVDYTPYGDQRATDGIQPHYQYAGLIWDGQAALFGSATRFYDARSARWLSRDWIREAGGSNLYAYVGGNPIMRIDPMGLAYIFIGGATDSNNGPVMKYVDQLKRENKWNKETDAYFFYNQLEEAMKHIKNLPQSEPVTVIGHSLGGDTAGQVAVGLANETKTCPGRVNTLITIDPVGSHRNYQAILESAGVWKNVNAVGGNWYDRNNIVAGLGGSWDDSPKSILGQNYREVDADHGQFRKLLEPVLGDGK